MIYLFCYILLTSISCIIIKWFSVELPLEQTLLLAITFAILFFHIINFNNIIPIYKKLITTKWLYLQVMISIMVIWLFTFIGSAYVSPTSTIFLLMLVGVMFAIGAEYKTTKNIFDLICFATIFLLYIIFIHYILHTRTPINSFGIFIIILLIGVADYIYAKSSYSLMQIQKLSATQMLAVRFWLLFALITLHMFMTNKVAIFIRSINPHLILSSFFIALTTFIIPIFMYQKSIQKLGVNTPLILSGTIPIITFLCEKYLLGEHVDIELLFFSIILFVIVCLHKLINAKIKRYYLSMRD